MAGRAGSAYMVNLRCRDAVPFPRSFRPSSIEKEAPDRPCQRLPNLNRRCFPVCPFSVRSHPSLGLFVFFLSTQQHVVFTPSSEEKGRSRRGKHEADKARQRRSHALSSEPLNPEGLPGSRPEAGHWWGDCPASGGRGWRYKRESTGRPRGGYRDADGSMTEVHPARLHAGRAAQGLVARRGRREATPRAPMFYYNAKQKHTKLRRLALSMPPRACHDCRRP